MEVKLDGGLFLFRCYGCEGEQIVKEEVFRRFLPQNVNEELDKMLASGANGAVFYFQDRCPGCSTQGVSGGKIAALYKKTNKAKPTTR